MLQTFNTGFCCQAWQTFALSCLLINPFSYITSHELHEFSISEATYGRTKDDIALAYIIFGQNAPRNPVVKRYFSPSKRRSST